ncbi:MAG: DUF2723 domain-containing protein [Chloroflexota bacterium]|nr:MAG: DUF2723 domain-containing protein [Chloroflexota bacterium]
MNSQAANSSSAVRQSPDLVIALFIALLLFGVYLLSFNGRITSSDGLSMFAVTESLVKRGDVSTDQMWTFFGTKSASAPNGEVYSKYGYGASLLAAPFYALALYVPFSGLMQVTLLSSAIAIALTGALVYLAARQLHFSAGVSVISALLFGLATPAWVYAKEFWSEPFAAMTLFAAFYFLLRYRVEWKTRDAVFAGILLGLAIAVRTTNVLLVPLYALYGFVEIDRDAHGNLPFRIRWRDVGIFLLAILLFTLSIFFYNYIRFQNPFTTGYRADEVFSNNILLGAYGLLFSPGKGLLVYAPFLAALPFGVWQFSRTNRRELVFSFLLFAFYFILFSAWYYWWGGTNWAARFLVPTLPFLVLLCAPLVKLLLEPRTGFSFYLLRFVFIALVAVSFINELAGVSVNSLTYRLRAVNLSSNADWDSIFAPALSPLLGHWQTLKPTNLDVAWMRATPDSMQVDWLVVALTLLFVLFCAWMLFQLVRGKNLARSFVRGALIAAVALTLFSLARYADDPRLGGNAGYADALRTLEQSSTARDVLILNDDARARYLFNANRAPLKWYGLSRDPARWDAPTQALVTRLGQEYARVWFVFDESVDAPNPIRDWFETNLHEARRFDFEEGVTLVLYEAR